MKYIVIKTETNRPVTGKSKLQPALNHSKAVVQEFRILLIIGELHEKIQPWNEGYIFADESGLGTYAGSDISLKYTGGFSKFARLPEGVTCPVGTHACLST